METSGVGLEAEEELGDGNAGVFPHVEEEHGVGAVDGSAIVKCHAHARRAYQMVSMIPMKR